MRFLAIGFDFPKPDVELEIVVKESGLDAGRAAPLIRLAGHIRSLSGMDLEEGVSTRLLTYAAKLIAGGMGIDQALDVAIIEPLSDDADVQQSLRDLVATIYG